MGYFAISQVPLCAKCLMFKVRVFKASHYFFLVTQLNVWVFSWQAVALREEGTAGKEETKSFNAHYLTGIGVKTIRIL